MTVPEMRDEIIRLTEYDSNEPNQAQALMHLNLAAQECSRYTEYLIATRNYTVPAGVHIIEAPAQEFATIEELWWNGTRLYPYEDGWLLSSPANSPGTPTRYILSATRILLSTTTATSGTLTVRGALIHPTMTITEPNGCLFPPDLHYSLCCYAAGNWLTAYTPHQEQSQRAINLKTIAVQKWEQFKQQVITTGLQTMRYKG